MVLDGFGLKGWLVFLHSVLEVRPRAGLVDVVSV